MSSKLCMTGAGMWPGGVPFESSGQVGNLDIAKHANMLVISEFPMRSW